jgi:hypothetical protein
MFENPHSSFQHFHNQDGSWDSICMRCFETAARANNESDLALAAQDHSCTPPFIAQHVNDSPMEGFLQFQRVNDCRGLYRKDRHCNGR